MVLNWFKKKNESAKTPPQSDNNTENNHNDQGAPNITDNQSLAQAPLETPARSPSNDNRRTTDPMDKRNFDSPSENEEMTSALEQVVPSARKGLFNRLKKGLSKTREILTTDIDDLFGSKNQIDDDMLEELEELLITSDIGVQTAMDLLTTITKRISKIKGPEALKETLKQEIHSLLKELPSTPDVMPHKPHVVMVVGVNGVGKTTTIGKLAAQTTQKGETTLIVAADTFRAAAIEQLGIWAQRAGADMVKHKANSDPAAVAYDGMQAAVARKMDTVFIDTAGRLHTKVNLMEELKKIKRTVSKILPEAPHEILLVLDATTGQNALSQAKLFHEAIGVTGIALTKLDGTAKGGIVISICRSLNIPLQYIGVGEGIEDLQYFDAEKFADALF